MRNAKGQFKKGSHWRTPKPHWSRDWLVQQYEVERLPASEIAKVAGCTENTILYWLQKHGIARRSMQEIRAEKHWGASGIDNPMYGMRGRLNPRYVDGSSPERQRMYVRGEGRKFLRQVLHRDGYRCVRCGKGKSGPKSLHVHHIKPWAGNPSVRFDRYNVVTLCRECHRWVHSSDNTLSEYLNA